MYHQEMQANLESEYHCGITKLLYAAYQKDFTMQQCGKCKARYPDAMEWYDTLDEVQRYRVDRWLE